VINCYSNIHIQDHIPRVPWCIASATDSRFIYPGEIEHVQDGLIVQACAVVLIGVSAMDNKKVHFVTLVDRMPRFEAH
jgi:hypothetical protein